MPFESQQHLPIKRAREESVLESETDDMDFHHTETNLPPPLTLEYAALRADLQMITGTAVDSLYHRITADTKKTVNDAVATLKRTNELLHPARG